MSFKLKWATKKIMFWRKMKLLLYRIEIWQRDQEIAALRQFTKFAKQEISRSLSDAQPTGNKSTGPLISDNPVGKEFESVKSSDV